MNNIFKNESYVTRDDRSILKNQKAFTVWLTGLSATGKSTIANELERMLFSHGFHSTLLDGDNLRSGLNSNIGFTEEDRCENIRRTAEAAKLMVEAGIIVICALISPTNEQRQLAKAIIGKNDFVEVFIDTPLCVVEKRDPKGLYKLARQGKITNFTGISSPYEPPLSPDIHILTEHTSPLECTKIIFEWLITMNFIENRMTLE